MKATELRIGNYHYYHIIDKMDDRETYKWLERLVKTQYITASDWRILCEIEYELKRFNPKIQSLNEVWSPKQKRFVVLSIVRAWDYLSGDYGL